jgi:hypothetical protein
MGVLDFGFIGLNGCLMSETGSRYSRYAEWAAF